MDAWILESFGRIYIFIYKFCFYFYIFLGERSDGVKATMGRSRIWEFSFEILYLASA